MPRTEIRTTAEAHEANALPAARVALTDAGDAGQCDPLTPDLAMLSYDGKSPAQWAYERVVLYIQNFESRLDSEHEVVMGLTGSEAGVLQIEGVGYFDPNIVTFYGTDEEGAKTQLIQHVSQLNVILRAVPKLLDDAPPRRIGFQLAAELDLPREPVTAPE